MKVWNGIEEYSPDRPPTVATIGNYDGVHLGHRRILESVIADAVRRGAPSLLVTFDPHPVSVVTAEHRRPRLLATREQKLDLLESSGLDGTLILRFDEELAGLDGEAFFRDYLGGRVALAAVHVGRSFRFGRGRGGGVELLHEIGSRSGFDVVGVDPVRVDGTIVSSTEIRDAVGRGEVARARAMLGRPFAVSGEVVRGAGRGRELGFRTANLRAANELLPGDGVYVTDVEVLGVAHPSVTNVGCRPTYGDGPRIVETHLLEYDGDLYGRRLTLRFLERVRSEQRFRDPSELADQIARDRAAAEAFFRNRPLRLA